MRGGLTRGSRVGPYEVEELIGKGGMGEVYRARDTRLGRIVALKILAAELSSDEALRRRFEREARAISSLSHPNICALYDIGEDAGHTYLVMEYLEGESLAATLRRGPLSSDQAIVTAIEIARALEVAHRAGIVHRDLKAANVIMTRGGAKLVDFGLASISREGSTIGDPLTSEGSMLGTVDYMAPEQLTGDRVDARTDVFAFGVLLFEMVTASRPFSGANQASVIASILFSDPPSPGEVTADVHPRVERLIRDCLSKKPEQRPASAEDVRLELESLATLRPQPASARFKIRRARRWNVRRYLVGLGTILLVALAAAGAYYAAGRRSPAAPEREIRFSIIAPASDPYIAWPSISPDGSSILFIAKNGEGIRMVWLRELADSVARPVPGTNHAEYAFWSADGEQIAFVSTRQLRTVARSGGNAQVLSEIGSPRGAAWNEQGEILIAPEPAGGLFLLRDVANGLIPVTQLDRSKRDRSHRWPEFLPNGRHYLYVLSGPDPNRRGVWIGELGTKFQKRILPIETRTVYAEPGYLLFTKEGTLYAHRFDVEKLELEGVSIKIAEKVTTDLAWTGGTTMSVSRRGDVAYLTSPPVMHRIVVKNRRGELVRLVRDADEIDAFALSPDNSMIALQKTDPESGRSAIWLMEAASGVVTRFTGPNESAESAFWSPDGKSIYYSSDRTGPYLIYRKNVDGTGERLIVGGEHWVYTGSIHDNELYFHRFDDAGLTDILKVRIDQPAKPVPVVATERAEAGERVSPDGKWLAYRVNSTGRSRDVYLMSLQDPSIRWQVSNVDGFTGPWRRDGRELYYTTDDGTIMAAEFDGTRPGASRPLFNLGAYEVASTDYSVSADGEEFTVLDRVNPSERPRVEVALNVLPAR